MTNNPYFTLTFFTRKPRSEGYTDHKVYVRISVAGQQTDLAIGRSVRTGTRNANYQKVAPGAIWS